MEYTITDHIQKRASLAVLVIDDCTNKVISDGSIQVSIEGASKPIRKSEGYYVFINLETPKVYLTVKSIRYGTENRMIDLSGISRIEPLVKIRLKPNLFYPLPEGTTCLTGFAEPMSEIRVICYNVQKYYRLLYDYDGESQKDLIHIFNPDKSDLDGKLFQIRDKDDKNCETFYVINTKDRENNLYQMERNLKNSFKKAGTKIFPVFMVQADIKGEYFIPLWNLGENSIRCQCEMNGKQRINKSIDLELGKINKMNFDSQD